MTRIALALVLLSGCSLAFQSKPSINGGVAKSTSCSSSGVHWKIDAVGVLAGVAGIVVGIAMNAGETDHTTGNIIAGASGLATIGYAASMGNGIAWTDECRGLQAPTTTAAR